MQVFCVDIHSQFVQQPMIVSTGHPSKVIISEPSGYFIVVVSHPLIHIQYMHEVNGVAQSGSSPPAHAPI